MDRFNTTTRTYVADDVGRLKQLAELLDRQFSIGGIRFGLDSVIGLVPVVGDLISGALGFYIISEARRLGVSKWTRTRMYTNWGLDVTVGSLPLVGDIFDVAFKSNMKNLRLLMSDLERREVKQEKMQRRKGLAAKA